MLRLIGGRAAAAVSQKFSAPCNSLIPPSFQASGGALSFSTRSKRRFQGPDQNEDLEWEEDVDRKLPWPKDKQRKAEEKKKTHRRAVHKVVAVANSNAKEFRGSLPSYGDMRAAWVIAKVLADRAKEADVYTVVYIPRRGEKMDNRTQTIIDTLVDNDIALEFDQS